LDATASGADEIGEALQKVASTADNSGVSLEKAASWIATISSITRESASVIGNSLKSIISRYEQIKAKGFNEEDATQINDVTKALQAVGIAAVDAQGQLRPIAEVLDELGAKWDGLTKNEKAYVATTLAGTYQRNRLITLLDNYNDSLKNYEAALNSAGTAEQKFAIYQDSVQAKLDKLSATWEEFWQKSLNSDLIKGVIGLLTSLIDTFGNLQTVLSLVATGFALWKGNEILNFFKVLPKQIKTSIMSMQLFKDIQTATMMVAKGEATAIQGLALSFQSLGMSIKTAFLSNPLGWIAIGLTTVISLIDVFNQKQEEMRQKIEESAQEAKEQSDRITELMGKYNELIDLVDKDKNAKTQLQSVQDELIKVLGLEKDAIDLVNDAREESIKKVREEAIEKLKANENALIAAKKFSRMVDMSMLVLLF
jgi:Phage-related minor tail protein.